MKYSFNLLLLLSAIMVWSCQSDKVKSYSIQELEKNEQNVLRLPVAQKLDIASFCERLTRLDQQGIEKRLETTGIGIFEVSYALHYLGNRYFEADNFKEGMRIQKIAAENYLNPFAMIKLARIYAMPADKIKASLPPGQADDFEQDLGLSYKYLHEAINVSIWTMEKHQDRYALDDVNKIGGYLIELFEKGDSNSLGNFDVKAAREAFEQKVESLQSHYDLLYPKAISPANQ